jgi:hypothetical protein
LKEHGMNMEEHGRVDVSYGGSLLWRNNIFSLGTFYSNTRDD